MRLLLLAAVAVATALHELLVVAAVAGVEALAAVAQAA
jgi:hypothetical protein